MSAIVRCSFQPPYWWDMQHGSTSAEMADAATPRQSALRQLHHRAFGVKLSLHHPQLQRTTLPGLTACIYRLWSEAWCDDMSSPLLYPQSALSCDMQSSACNIAKPRLCRQYGPPTIICTGHNPLLPGAAVGKLSRGQQQGLL